MRRPGGWWWSVVRWQSRAISLTGPSACLCVCPGVTQALLTSDPAVQVTAGGVTLPPDAVALLGPPSCAGVTVEPSAAVAVRGDASPPQVPIIALAGAWEEVFQGEAKAALETLLPGYLQQWRWFGGKARPDPLHRADGGRAHFRTMPRSPLGSLLAVAYGEGEPETYVLPLTIAVGPRAEEVQQRVPPGRHRPGAAAGGGGAAVRGLVGAPVVGGRAGGHRPQRSASRGRQGRCAPCPPRRSPTSGARPMPPWSPPRWPPSRATPRSSTGSG